MSYTPPPPPPGQVPPPPPMAPSQVEEKVPPAAWLVPVAAVLAVIGVFTPWFKPQLSLSVNGQTRSGDAVDDALYSWKEGRLGLIAPIVLVLLAVGVVALLRGKQSRFHRGATSPIVNAARGALIAGAVAIVAVVIAYFLLPSQYKFIDGSTRLSWDDAIKYFEDRGAQNVELSQGPQIGLWLTVAGGVVALVAGALMLVTRDKSQPVPQSVPQPQAGQFPPPPAQGAPQSPPPGAPSGYGQPQTPPAGYGQPPTGYGQTPPDLNKH